MAFSGSLRASRKVLYLLTLTILSACAREEVLDDIESSYFEPQLVIHSLITPGDSILVNVGRSVPLGNAIEVSKVTDAVVEIANEQGQVVQLPLVHEGYRTTVYGISQQDFSIQAGATYILSVTHSQLPAGEATCTVPVNATPLTSVAYVGKSAVPDDGRLTYDVQVNWYDRGPYLHRAYFTSYYVTTNAEDGSILEQGTRYYGHDAFHGIEQNDSLFTYFYSFFSSDIYYDSDTLANGSISLGRQIEAPITYELTTYLITPDEHMARYQESQDIFARNRDALSSDSFIELYRGVIPEYSNVQGGLGVFGAYLRSEPVYLTLE